MLLNQFIYILSANDDDIIIYNSVKKPTEQILLECSAHYSYLTPNRIVDEIPFVDPFDLDKLVKQYMYYYGIDKVRGGTYDNEFLSDEQVTTLISEFTTIGNLSYQSAEISEYFTSDIQTLHKKILQKYKKPQVFETVFDISKCVDQTYEVKDAKYENTSSLELNNQEWQKYKETKKKYDYIKCFYINGVEVEFQRRIQTEIQDIKNILLYGEQCDVVSKEMKNKYKETILMLKHLTKSFSMVGQNVDELYNPSVYLHNPEFVFDRLFFHRNKVVDWNGYVTECHTFVDIFERMATKLLNKMAELEYDLSTHPTYADAYYRLNKDVLTKTMHTPLH